MLEDEEEVLVEERIKELSGKLTQKQREGDLSEELKLCHRLASLHSYLCPSLSPVQDFLKLESGPGRLKKAIQFWRSCQQISDDLGDEEEMEVAAAEIAKLLAGSGYFEDAEAFARDNLSCGSIESSLSTASNTIPSAFWSSSYLLAEVLLCLANIQGEHWKDYTKQSLWGSAESFNNYQKALKALGFVLELDRSTAATEFCLKADMLRAVILGKLGAFEEAHYEEAIGILKAIVSSNEGNRNISIEMKARANLAHILADIEDYEAALEASICVVDIYRSDSQNSRWKPRREVYCEMLELTGRLLTHQGDFSFALTNLLLAQEEFRELAILGANRGLKLRIQESLRRLTEAKAADCEARQREKSADESSPKELESLAELWKDAGNFEKATGLLQKCLVVALNSQTKQRLTRKLAELYWKSGSFSQVIRLEGEVDEILVLKAKFHERMGNFAESREILEGLRRSKEALWSTLSRNDSAALEVVYGALFFHYRQLGFQTESLGIMSKFPNLESRVRSRLGRLPPASTLLSDFSYFASRKPSNSLMKMMGSGMVMRTKTRKRRGLDLQKRTRGIKVRSGKGARLASDSGFDYGFESNSFIDDSEIVIENQRLQENRETREDDEIHEISTGRLNKSASVKPSIIEIDSSTSEAEEASVSDDVQQYAFDSPLLVKVKNLTNDGSNLFNDEEHNTGSSAHCFIDGLKRINLEESLKEPSFTQYGRFNRVIIRFMEGKEVVIPLSKKLIVSVADLIIEANHRYSSLFPGEAEEITGLMTINPPATLFPADSLQAILSRDSEVLLASFDKNGKGGFRSNECRTGSNGINSTSKSSMIEEEFRRKLHLLTIKRASEAEFKNLKKVKKRFEDCLQDNVALDLSQLGLESKNFSELVSVFTKLSHDHSLRLNISENCLSDEDVLKIRFPFKSLDFSMNFLRRPDFINCGEIECLNFAYNPIDLNWLVKSVLSGKFRSLKELNLIGSMNDLTRDLSVLEFKRLSGWFGSNLKKLQVSLMGIDSKYLEALFTGLKEACVATEPRPDAVVIEELTVFGASYGGCSLLFEPLSHLRRLKVLNLPASKFESSVDSLAAFLRRTNSLQHLNLMECDLSAVDWKRLAEMGISKNFSLKSVAVGEDDCAKAVLGPDSDVVLG